MFQCREVKEPLRARTTPGGSIFRVRPMRLFQHSVPIEVCYFNLIDFIAAGSDTYLSKGAYPIHHLFPLLQGILKRRGLHFLVPPFNASAQVGSLTPYVQPELTSLACLFRHDRFRAVFSHYGLSGASPIPNQGLRHQIR